MVLPTQNDQTMISEYSSHACVAAHFAEFAGAHYVAVDHYTVND